MTRRRQIARRPAHLRRRSVDRFGRDDREPDQDPADRDRELELPPRAEKGEEGDR